MLGNHVALFLAANALVSSMARVSAQTQDDGQADISTEADISPLASDDTLQPVQDPTETTTLTTSDNNSSNNTSGGGIAPWAIAIIVILILLIAVSVLLLALRKRGRTPTVVPSVTDDEKKVPSVPSLRAQSTPAVPELHYDEKIRPSLSESVKQEDFKITLPMLPASTSLFSDKLELSSEEAAELYKQYMNQKDDFCSVDIDQPQQRSDQWHQRLSTGMAKRATTIRSTLRQSMRRQRSTNKSQSSTAPLHEIFDDVPQKSYAPSMNSAYTEKMAMDDFYQNEALKEKSLPDVPSVPSPNVLPTPVQAVNSDVVPVVAQSTTKDVSDSQLNHAAPSSASVAESAPYIPTQKDQGPSAPVQETTSHAAAHRVIMDASVRSKRRSILPIPTREEFVSHQHQHQQPQRDIVDWWQNESMIESDRESSEDGGSSLASSPSMLANALQQQHDIMSRQNSHAQLSSISRQSSFSRSDRPSSIVSGRSPPSFMQLSRQSSILSGVSLSHQTSTALPTSPSVHSQKPSIHSAAPASMREPSVAESKRNSTLSSVRPSLESLSRREPPSSNRSSILELFRRSSQLQSNQSSVASRQSTASSRPQVTPSNLMSLSWRAQQQRQLVPDDEESREEPVPTVSFSSSTVQTMIPENEYEQIAAERVNAVKNKPTPKKKPASPKNGSSKKLNSKKAATASAATGKAANNNKEGASTLHGGRRQSRGSIPWMQQAEKGGKSKKTPAQRERDRYLQSLNK